MGDLTEFVHERLTTSTIKESIKKRKRTLIVFTQLMVDWEMFFHKASELRQP